MGWSKSSSKKEAQSDITSINEKSQSSYTLNRTREGRTKTETIKIRAETNAKEMHSEMQQKRSVKELVKG